MRQHNVWGWFDSVPFAFGPPQSMLRGTMLSLAMVGGMALTLVGASCTRGAVLEVSAGLGITETHEPPSIQQLSTRNAVLFGDQQLCRHTREAHAASSW